MYLKSDTLLLANIFKNFRKMCLEIYDLGLIYWSSPGKMFLAPRLTWQAAFKKTKVELELFRDVDMLLMVKKGIRGGIWHSIKIYAN